MSMSAPAEDAPPPAYSEEELDHKISQAVQESLRLDAKGRPHDNGEEEWEEWDDALFEENCHTAQSPGAGSSSSAASPPPMSPRASTTSAASPPPSIASSSSSNVGRMPSVRPLRLHRASTSNNSEKPRPSWYVEAGLAPEGSSSDLPPPPPPPRIPSPPQAPVRPPAENDDAEHEPPPAFTPVGPSLDGPEYEEVARPEYRTPDSQAPSPLTSPVMHAQDAVRMSYEGPQGDDLDEEDDEEDVEEIIRHPPPKPQPRVRGPRGLPMPAQTRMNAPMPPPLANIPRLQFNPSMAYKREESVMEQTAAPAPPPKGNAMAFYNSAVSSVLQPRTAPHVPASVNNRYTSLPPLPPGAGAPRPSAGYGNSQSEGNRPSWYNPTPVHAPVASYPTSAPQFYHNRQSSYTQP
ncbi:hypothetical protein BD626DRAFT_479022 [Schizophyllum amplum]|uniref:Uncharacterized protein n=1 Tax=Schizophyllum amplum TaxID=97359 RepID=A0A550CRU8_9AGAR|nr:hypothetical protein BD626DRAFT_479022 [Auriculariopsis ampla]